MGQRDRITISLDQRVVSDDFMKKGIAGAKQGCHSTIRLILTLSAALERTLTDSKIPELHLNRGRVGLPREPAKIIFAPAMGAM
jgi:hypothetical protein